MKKVVLGIVSSLGGIGLGKLIYEKGRRDQAKQTCEHIDAVMKGIEIERKSKEESE